MRMGGYQTDHAVENPEFRTLPAATLPKHEIARGQDLRGGAGIDLVNRKNRQSSIFYGLNETNGGYLFLLIASFFIEPSQTFFASILLDGRRIHRPIQIHATHHRSSGPDITKNMLGQFR